MWLVLTDNSAQRCVSVLEPGMMASISVGLCHHCRFTEEQQARLGEVLRAYEGTHSFHNFTVRVPASDPAAKRYILSFKCAGTMEMDVSVQWLLTVMIFPILAQE